MKYSEEDKTFLKENYHFLDKKSILENLGRTWSSIKHKAKKMGLSRPNIRGAKLKKLLDNNLISAYWWGFIMADGHLSEKGSLVIALSEKDKNHLEKIKSYLGGDINLSKEKGEMIRLAVMDKINGQLLIKKLKIKNKKTYNPPENFDFLKNIEERLAFFHRICRWRWKHYI